MPAIAASMPCSIKMMILVRTVATPAGAGCIVIAAHSQRIAPEGRTVQQKAKSQKASGHEPDRRGDSSDGICGKKLVEPSISAADGAIGGHEGQATHDLHRGQRGDEGVDFQRRR